jgi:hypothetical protein
MYHFNNHKKNKAKVTRTATLFMMAAVVVVGAINSTIIAPLTSPHPHQHNH